MAFECTKKKRSKLKQTENLAGDLTVFVSKELWICRLPLVLSLLLTEVTPLY